MDERAVIPPRSLEPTTERRPSPGGRVAPGRVGDNAYRSAQVLAYVDVMRALCDLSRTDRAALRLIYWHGRTQAQVADELHLPVSAVRAAVARGMQQIATSLDRG